MSEMKPHKHAGLIKSWADGAEIQVFSEGDWYDYEEDESPMWSCADEYRIKPLEVPQWRKDLASKMKAGGILEHWNGATADWRHSGYCIDEILCSDYMKRAYASSYRIKPQPKPDVVTCYNLFCKNNPVRTNEHHADIKVIWDGETGELKSAEVINNDAIKMGEKE